jgi:hypothetical protein
MKMQESIVKESPRRRIACRVGAAGMTLAAVLTLGACRATGGGYVGQEPLPGPLVGEFTGDANFGFNFTCEMETAKKRAVIKGEITYHDDPSTIFGVLPDPFPEVRLHGTVDPILVQSVASCEDAIEGLPSAVFGGTYRPQEETPWIPENLRNGEFSVEVFDQGEPSASVGDFTGDSFSIELFTGAYAGYARGGYIEGGNIQVES